MCQKLSLWPSKVYNMCQDAMEGMIILLHFQSKINKLNYTCDKSHTTLETSDS